MNKEADEAILNGIVAYADQKDVKGLLKEYMRRLIIDQPDDPIKFLISSITENPYVPPGVEFTASNPTDENTPKQPESSSLPF